MFEKFSTLFALTALVATAACAQPAASEASAGSVEFVSIAPPDAGYDAPSRLTITGLDRSFHARVELSSDKSSRDVRVELPAGLYAVDAAASAGGGEPVVPAHAAPNLIVVAAGRVTTVKVRRVDAEPLATAALDAALQR
ncbi:MAG TPA: hypothetical protein VNN80_02960 [Polyangiaceae bacterium]|nr:hypothetical protein [Polyangiaceae bacterium]